MSLATIGRWLRNEADNIGSIVTGQPAHGPAPAPAPQAPQVRAPGPAPISSAPQGSRLPGPQISLTPPPTSGGISLRPQSPAQPPKINLPQANKLGLQTGPTIKVPQSGPVAPQRGDVAGLRKALDSISLYNPEDQIRIVSRSGLSGIIPRNVAAATVKNSLSPNTPYHAPSGVSSLGNAAVDVLLPGFSNLARVGGSNIAANSLLNKANKGQMDYSDVKNILQDTYNANGYDLDQPLSKTIRTGVGQAIEGTAALAGYGAGAGAAGAEAAQAGKLASVPGRLQSAAKIGVTFGVPQGVGATLQEDHPTVGSAAKNIALGVAQNTAMPFAAGEAAHLGQQYRAFHPNDFAGLKPKQIIMDPAKLDVLNNARQVLTTHNNSAPVRNYVNNGLHEIYKDHGLDFISGSPADRLQRISQYLEQNGEAIPQYQQFIVNKPSLASQASGHIGGDDAKVDRTKLTGKSLDVPSAQLSNPGEIVSGRGSRVSKQIQEQRTRQSDMPANPPEFLAPSDEFQAALPAQEAAREAQGQELKAKISQPHTAPGSEDLSSLTPDEIERMREDAVKEYQLNDFPVAGKGNMKNISDRQMNQIVQEAKRRGEGEAANVVQRHAILDRAIRNGVAKGEDRLFFEAVEHPEKINDILTKVEDPDKFVTAVNEMRNFNDYAAERSTATGTPVNYRQNYLRHNVDLSDPEQQARFAELVKARGRLSRPGYTKERIFDDLNDLEGHGFQLKYNKARDLATDYANSVASTVKRNALVNHLKTEAPGHITTVDTEQGRIPIDDNGAPFVTGRNAGLQKTFLSPKLARSVASYVEPIKLGKAAKAVDVIGQTAKQSTLALGGFHDLNVTKRYITQEIASGLTGEPKRLLDAVVNSAKQDVAFWSKEYFTKQLAHYRDTGLLDRVTHDGNLTLDKNLDVGSLDKELNPTNAAKFVQGAKSITMLPKHVNEFLHSFLFSRKIPLMKLQTIEAEMERENIPLKGKLTEAQRKKLVALTDQVNNMYGGINKGLIARTGAGKYIQRQLMLAPDFTGGNINSVVNMVHGDAKSLAWRQNMGNYLTSLVLASVASGLVAAAKGEDGKKAAEDKLKKLFDPHSGEFLEPSINLPYKDKKGNKLVVTMPGAPVQEAIKLRDPAHFLISRGGAGVRNAAEIATNTNYYGQPLVDPNKDPNPSVLERIKAAAPTNAPIPVANSIKLNNGQQNIASAVLNTAGLRVTKDPTDPQVRQQRQYYKALAEATNKLTPNDKAAWGVVHPVTKDYSGGYVIKPTVFDTQDKAATYLAHDNVLAIDTKLNQVLQKQGQKIDPFFNLPAGQQKAYLQYQLIDKNNTGQLAIWKQNNPWYDKFENDRAVFYNSLPPSDPNKPKVPIQAPAQKADVQEAFKQYDSIADPQQRSQFFAAHPEMSQWMDQYSDYVNKTLVAQGLTPLKPYPKADAETQSFMNTYMNNPGQRATLKASNPADYQKMQAYLQNINEYEVAKNGALDQFQGQSPNQKLLKGINSLATYDMVRNPDGTLALKYSNQVPGNTAYGGTAAPQAGAISLGSGGYGQKTKKFKYRKAYVKKVRVRKVHKPHIYLQKPPSPIKIRNKAPQHVGIKRTTYL